MPSASSVMPAFSAKNIRGGGRTLKYRCYLVCLLGLLFSVSDPTISHLGLFFLSAVVPFSAARRQGVHAAGKHIIWLILALSAAAGILSGSRYLPPALCLLLAIVFWILYLAYGVLAPEEVAFENACKVAFSALFSNPWGFFVSLSSDTMDERRRRVARYLYIVYLLLFFFVTAILLVLQADARIGALLRTFWALLTYRLPLVVSCLILALFPAAFIYGFLTELRPAASELPDADDLSALVFSPRVLLPWSALSLLLTAVNSFFLLAELYYNHFLREAPLPVDYGFYDIFAILALVLFSLTVLFYRLNPLESRDRALFICLSVSDLGLLSVAASRIWNYIYYHGLWGDREILCILFLLWIALSLCILPLSGRRSSNAAHNAGIAVAVVLIALLILPKGLFLTQFNVSLFLHKYNAGQLEAQQSSAIGGHIALTANDLDVESIGSYGIGAVPALARLSKIDDMTYAGQALGGYAQASILELFCADLNIPFTGNPAVDLPAIQAAAAAAARYRLPSLRFIAIQSLDGIDWSYGQPIDEKTSS